MAVDAAAGECISRTRLGVRFGGCRVLGKEEFEAGDDVIREFGVCCCSGRCIEGIWFVRAVRGEVMVNLHSDGGCGSIGFAGGGGGGNVSCRTSWFSCLCSAALIWISGSFSSVNAADRIRAFSSTS